MIRSNQTYKNNSNLLFIDFGYGYPQFIDNSYQFDEPSFALCKISDRLPINNNVWMLPPAIMKDEVFTYLSEKYVPNTFLRYIISNYGRLYDTLCNKFVPFRLNSYKEEDPTSPNKGYCSAHVAYYKSPYEIGKKDIWKSMLSNLLGKTDNKIYARKCSIKEVDAHIANEFLENNHIQGACPSTIKVGLYYNNELVSLMTFGKSRHFIGNCRYEYELLRFCNKINTTVIGGASKLFNYFVKSYHPMSVVSYADRRWSNGNLYEKLGFTFSHYSKPNYFYVIDNKRRNRFNFRKSVLSAKYNCPSHMSEKEFCRLQKWYRIYDCGTLCFYKIF